MIYCFGDFECDETRHELRQAGQVVAIEPKVFEVLRYFLEHPDRVVSKDELLEHCWPDTFVSEAALTRCLTKLRKIVHSDPTAQPVIKTVPRRGYRFVAALTIHAPEPVADAGDTTFVQDIRSSPLAERRQLTVMFCDVVESTILAGQLDPEDYRDVILRYQTTCTVIIERYSGHIAQYLGDGLLVYFGYPQAHEDDAQRAIHAGLEMLTALADLSHRLAQPYGIHLAARLGIHTGLVVVGEVGGGPQHGQLALGVTPNIAARIQAMATPGSVVISDATCRLVQGYFVCQSLGDQVLPGVAEPIPLYQVLHVSEARGRLDAASPRGLTPLVGRDVEVALLQERWAQVQQGIGQVVVLSGEAGIGKSRLVRALIDRLTGTPFTRLECRCSPYHQHTALYPLVDLLQRSLQFAGTMSPDEKMARLEGLLHDQQLDAQVHLPPLASLLSLPLPAERYPPLQLTPQQQRQRTLDTLLALTLAVAAHEPVLFIVEDLHWIDPSTLEWLGLLIDQGPTTRVLTFMTCRPTFQNPWGGRAHVTSLTINRLLPQQVAQMARTIADADVLPAPLLDQIVAQTDGVPLFVEEVTRFVMASRRLHGHASETAASAPPGVTIPATLHDLLMARLDQMGAAKGTAQLAATIGREFGFALLQAVASAEEETLRQDLRRLVDAELLYQRGVGAQATYVFKHALIQEVAYASLLRRTRQHYHQWIAQALERQFAEVATVQPEQLAHHYTEAGLVQEALPYWQRAGQQAAERSAHVEAIVHLNQGLRVLTTLPETRARDQQELTLRIDLGKSLSATTGWASPEAEVAYTRAWELCQQTCDTSWVFAVLWGLSQVYIVRADLTKHREVGAQFLSLAEQRSDAILLAVAHWLTGVNLWHVGEFATGLAHLEQAYARYDPQHHHTYVTQFGVDVGVFALSYISHSLWGLGYPDQAVQRSREVLALAQEVQHPFSLALAQDYAAMLQQFRREPPTANTHAEIVLTVCTEQGFAYYLAWATIIQGWVVAETGRLEAGIAQMQQGLTTLQATGGGLRIPYYLALLAEAYGNHDGRPPRHECRGFHLRHSIAH
jgi:predicted ATPase/class 3 adenylate cyclase